MQSEPYFFVCTQYRRKDSLILNSTTALSVKCWLLLRNTCVCASYKKISDTDKNISTHNWYSLLVTDDGPGKCVLDEDESTIKIQLFIYLSSSIPFQQAGEHDDENWLVFIHAEGICKAKG